MAKVATQQSIALRTVSSRLPRDLEFCVTPKTLCGDLHFFRSTLMRTDISPELSLQQVMMSARGAGHGGDGASSSLSAAKSCCSSPFSVLYSL